MPTSAHHHVGSQQARVYIPALGHGDEDSVDTPWARRLLTLTRGRGQGVLPSPTREFNFPRNLNSCTKGRGVHPSAVLEYHAGPGSLGQGVHPSLPSPPPLSHHMCAHAHAYMLEGSSQGVHPSWPAPCMDMSARTHGCLHVRLRTRAATNARRFRRRRPAWNGQELEDLVGTWAGKFRPGLPSGSGHGDVGSRGGGSGRGSGGGSLVFLALLIRLAR